MRSEKQLSYTQRAHLPALIKIEEQLKNIRSQMDVLKRCGLEKEAEAHLLPKLNDWIKKREKYLKGLNEDRRAGAFALIMCLTAANLCTILCDKFNGVIHYISMGTESGTALSQQLDEQAEAFNKLVRLIEDACDYRMEAYYAKMIDDAEEAAEDAMRAVIRKYMDTDSGVRYF